jgi:hypothetical protein
MSFIQKRCIHDNFLHAQNVIRALHKFKCSSLFIKLDICHTFDLISCPFLLEIMEALGFGQTWRNWTMTLLITTSSKTLLNGIPGKTYRHSRRLRQGDPLSNALHLGNRPSPQFMELATQKGYLHPILPNTTCLWCSLYTAIFANLS